MNVEQVTRLADEWTAMGWSAQAQAQAFFEGGDPGDMNPNAREVIADWLRNAIDENVEGALELAAELRQA